jgi:(2Fe-2S) ferredoxin
MEAGGRLGERVGHAVRVVAHAAGRWLRAVRRGAVGAACPDSTPAGCTVTVCRGCCCGTPGKHPDVDHARQLSRLRAGVTTAGRVRVSGCLDLCEDSNVVVVCPSAAGRRTGARAVWLVDILEDQLVTDIVEWVGAGGPGMADPPPRLSGHAVEPPRRSRRALSGGPV